MKRTLLYRLFGVGSIPGGMRAALEAEGILALDEGVGGWMVEKNLQSPRRASLFLVRSFTGFLVVTRERIVLQTYGTPQLELALDDRRVSELHIDLAAPGRLLLSFDYGVFRKGWKGQVEFRIRTSNATRFYEALHSAGATRACIPWATGLLLR